MTTRRQKKAIIAHDKRQRDDAAEALRIERQQRLADRIEQDAMDRATLAALTEIADDIHNTGDVRP